MIKIFDEVVTADDDLVYLRAEGWVHTGALERVLEHPKELLEVAICTRHSALFRETLF